jgi:hypothetical protein
MLVKLPMPARRSIKALSPGTLVVHISFQALCQGPILTVASERHAVDSTGPTRCHLNLMLKISYPDHWDLERAPLTLGFSQGFSHAEPAGRFVRGSLLAIHNQLLLAQSDQDQQPPESAGPSDVPSGYSSARVGL